VKTHTFENRRHVDKNGSLSQTVDEFTNGDESFCKLNLLDNKFTIFNKKYMEDVMKYNWLCHKHSGYIMHTKRNGEEEIKTTQIYLHSLIMKLEYGDPNFDIEKHVTSVDHINRQRYDNRVSNLRIATNSEQNYNQRMRCDRNLSLDELVQVGIYEYARFIRFDKTQERFVLESHPALHTNKDKNKRQNGTRKGSIVEKYFEILHLGHDLDKQLQESKSNGKICVKFEEKQKEELDKCIELIKSFNKHYTQNQISIDDVYDEFNNTSSYKKQIDFLLCNEELGLKDPNILHEENGFILTKKMCKPLNKHMHFTSAKNNIGCYFEYDFKDPVTKIRSSKRLVSSVKVSLEDKFKSALDFKVEDLIK
jgi:hypothetical protein